MNLDDDALSDVCSLAEFAHLDVAVKFAHPLTADYSK